MTLGEMKRMLEAALLCAAAPLPEATLQSLFDDAGDRDALEAALRSLQTDWADRGLELTRTAPGWRFQTRPDLARRLARLSAEPPPRASRALLETLAIIAYRQPVTRGDIEAVRGVVVHGGLMRQLEERGWVRAVGRKESLGRPVLYGTTTQFLDDLGLRSLHELPSLPAARALEGAVLPLTALEDTK